MRKLHQLGAERAPRITILALGTLTALALAGPVSAAQPDKAPGKHRMEAEAPANGMQVAIDKATGKIRQPTAAESQALASQIKAMMVTKAAVNGDPQVTTYPDGTMSAVIPPDLLNIWMVQVNADGTLSQICVDAANAANALPAAAPAFEEK
jgi:hypothetical protein